MKRQREGDKKKESWREREREKKRIERINGREIQRLFIGQRELHLN